MPSNAKSPAAGWYDDPTDGTRSRFWDGASWTDKTRRRHAVQPTSAELDPVGLARGGGRPRKHFVVAVAGVVAAVALVVVGVVTLAVMRSDRQVATFDAVLGHPEDAPVVEQPEEDSAAVVARQRADSSTGSGHSGEITEPPDDSLAVAPSLDTEVDDRWPWEQGAEGAPIAVHDEARWIVVAASLNAQDFTIADAELRAAEWAQATRQTPLVLLSDHYPSLNPNLWVVAFGPYEDEETATRTCTDEIGGGCYARVLSVQSGDRYCIASDGCEGERR